MACKRLTDSLIVRLNCECSKLKGAGECPDSCDSIGWCGAVWDGCGVNPAPRLVVVNKAHEARGLAENIRYSLQFREEYPFANIDEYLSDLERLSDMLEEIADWVVLGWHRGKPTKTAMRRNWNAVVGMCFDAYMHANPENENDLKRLPARLGEHEKRLKDISRDLRRAVPPGSLGVPCSGFFDGEGRAR